MFDWFKIFNLNVSAESLINNELLCFPLYVVENDGEILDRRRTATFNKLIFTITPEQIIKLQGSFHTYKNSGLHNYNDFSYVDFVDVLIDLFRKFGINPKNQKLNFIEFGLNIETPFNPSMFIDNLICHNSKPFNFSQAVKKNYAVVDHQRYDLKIYNKGLQFGSKMYILRIEIKVKKMEHLNKLGIVTLWDLLNSVNLEGLKKILIKCFDEIVFWDDTINLDETNDSERILLIEGNNPRFWKSLQKNAGNNASKKRNRFKSLVNKYGKLEFYKLSSQINDKWHELSIINTETVRKLTAFEKELDNQKYSEILIQEDPFNTQINISNNMLQYVHPETILQMVFTELGFVYL